MKDQYDDLQQSYGRCLRAGGFIERFYEIFLASHDQIELAFSSTDFQKQRLALRRGISIAISHAAGSYLSKLIGGLKEFADTRNMDLDEDGGEPDGQRRVVLSRAAEGLRIELALVESYWSNWRPRLSGESGLKKLLGGLRRS